MTAEATFVLDLARFLVQRPSEQSAAMEADPAILGFVRDHVGPLLTGWDLSPRFDAMGNLWVELGPEGPAPSLALVGYAMTHPRGAMVEPFAGEVVEGPSGPAVRGRGIAEQKGALAAALRALHEVRSWPLRGRLSFLLLTAGETGRHDAIRSVLAASGRRPDLAIVLIGTNQAVALGNKGRIDVDITVRGAVCHSSMPWAGVDAIQGARRLLDVLDGLDLGGTHPGLGTASLVATHLRSFPEATHTLQDEVRLTLDRRLLPGDDPKAALAAIAAAARLEGPWQIEVRAGPFMHPAELAPEGSLLSAIERGCAAEGLPVPRRFWSHGALDAGFLQVEGAEATMWGPGDPAMWHRPDEVVPVADLVAAAAAYRGLVRAVLVDPSPSA
ncbi:MAG: M20/M25/M40 family metallo-hydrolase [Geminicoccaceae bacterium]|nr:MAG: M20/M25/M40 family metallo-hydrolase [Geminicoccaceae bacterium]